jgi:DNA-binding response OmpR family regulator
MEAALARSRLMVLDLSGRRILIVEDEPLIALEIAQILESARASVLVAATLDEALRLTEQAGLSAAVLDLVLGANDGASLCARLRERAIPFVIYSGRTDIPVGCEPGAFVSKPAHPHALLQAIAGVLLPH